MPISQNPKETGWFYHAPAKKVNMDKVEAPAPSQIPGIGYDDPEDLRKQEVREMMFKDTDSDYIRLAKMGGRKDLLSFNPDKFKAKENRRGTGPGHHRSDWFYLEDNRLEEEEQKEAEKKEWQFLLPDYMVHQGYKPSFSNPTTPPTRGNNNNSGAPFHTEEQPNYDDTDRFASKIPEPRKEGYGIRTQKAPPKVQPLPPREKPANHSALRNRAKPQFGLPSENEAPTNMMKLLAGEYEREWHTAHDQFERTTRGNQGQGQANVKESSSNTSAGKQRADAEAGISAAAMRRKAREQEEKDFFKLQRFKNVPSKVDSYQRPDILAAAK